MNRGGDLEISLPVNSPFIITYKHHALKLAMAGELKKVSPWIASNFIQLYTPYNIMADSFCDPHWLDFFLVEGCDESWLAIDPIMTSMIQGAPNVEQLIEEIISSGSYLYVYCDSYYIPFSSNYKQEHDPSNLIVYGYDQNNRYFFVYDYNFKGSRKLEKLKIAYHELLTSIINLDTKVNDWVKTSKIYTVKGESDFSLDIELANKLLRDYVNSKPSYTKTNNSLAYKDSLFGKNVYLAMYHHLNLMQRGYPVDNILPYSIFWEHKKTLNLLISFLNSDRKVLNNNIVHKFMELEQNALTVRNMLLKYNFKSTEELILKAISKIQEIENEEVKYIEHVMREIY